MKSARDDARTTSTLPFVGLPFAKKMQGSIATLAKTGQFRSTRAEIRSR